MVTEVLNYFNETYNKLVYDQIILLHVIIFQEKQRGKLLYNGWKAEYFILLFCAYVIVNYYTLFLLLLQLQFLYKYWIYYYFYYFYYFITTTAITTTTTTDTPTNATVQHAVAADES